MGYLEKFNQKPTEFIKKKSKHNITKQQNHLKPKSTQVQRPEASIHKIKIFFCNSYSHVFGEGTITV